MFCPECDEERLPRLETRRETLSVRGEAQCVAAEVLVCPVCGRDLADQERDGRTLLSAYNAYRQRHGLLRPVEIRDLRQRYHLSQRSMAKLLGLGLATIQRYESGALQDEAHDMLLRCFADPKNAWEMAARNRNQVSPRQWALFEEAISGGAMAQPPGGHPPAGDGGAGEAESLALAIRYLLSEAAHRDLVVGRTKLLKLWWLADFLHFRMFGRAITGVEYVALPRGPVPHNFKAHLRRLEEAGEIDEVEVSYGRYEGYEYRVGDPESGELLSPTERSVIAVVVERFGGLTAQALSDMAHREPLWAAFVESGRVPYRDAHALAMLEGLPAEVRGRLREDTDGPGPRGS